VPAALWVTAQHGRSALCADLLRHADRESHTPEEWRQWHRTTRKRSPGRSSSNVGGTADRTIPRSVWYTPRATAEPVASMEATGIYLHPSRSSSARMSGRWW
jgi:hypothetical protein